MFRNIYYKISAAEGQFEKVICRTSGQVDAGLEGVDDLVGTGIGMDLSHHADLIFSDTDEFIFKVSRYGVTVKRICVQHHSVLRSVVSVSLTLVLSQYKKGIRIGVRVDLWFAKVCANQFIMAVIGAHEVVAVLISLHPYFVAGSGDEV